MKTNLKYVYNKTGMIVTYFKIKLLLLRNYICILFNGLLIVKLYVSCH